MMCFIDMAMDKHLNKSFIYDAFLISFLFIPKTMKHRKKPPPLPSSELDYWKLLVITIEIKYIRFCKFISLFQIQYIEHPAQDDAADALMRRVLSTCNFCPHNYKDRIRWASHARNGHNEPNHVQNNCLSGDCKYQSFGSWNSNKYGRRNDRV